MHPRAVVRCGFVKGPPLWNGGHVSPTVRVHLAVRSPGAQTGIRVRGQLAGNELFVSVSPFLFLLVPRVSGVGQIPGLAVFFSFFLPSSEIVVKSTFSQSPQGWAENIGKPPETCFLGLSCGWHRGASYTIPGRRGDYAAVVFKAEVSC